jgi:acylglycerol lipase
MELDDAVFSLDYDGEDFTIPIYDGKILLRGCEWRPESQPEFVLIYVHGMGSFLTAEHDVGEIIVENGGAFLGCDHLGHGRSPGARAGCTVSEVVQETEVVIQKARESFPDLPLFVAGCSMGALAVLQLVFAKSVFASQHLRGVVCISPLLSVSPAQPIGFLESVAIMLLARFAPYTVVASGIAACPSDVRPDYAKLFEDCPLFSPWTTPRLLDSVLRTITGVRKSHEDWPSELPVLFLQGGADLTVDPAENVAWFSDLVNSSAKEIVDYQVYEFGSHNLLHGPYRAVVMQDILNFINRHKQ